MHHSESDITALFPQPAEPHFEFRQGIVTFWDATTGENTVNVGGSTFANLPILTTSEVTSLAIGNVVGILHVRSQYFIIGRIANSDFLDIPAASAGRGLLENGYSFATSALPAGGVTTNVHTATGLNVTVDSPPNRLLRISLYCSAISTVAGDRVPIAIRDTALGLPDGYSGPLTIPTDSAYGGLGLVYIQERGVTVQAGPRAQICPIIALDDRGWGGSRTYAITISRFAGSGTVRMDADAPGPSTLMVEDVGPLF